ncbi:putative methyltransferase-domain-containing protein [Fimicolochytrium jonesii]|uniref:putative methyltransferase-domain-containing protein n=1 Tax=Fimicolochytrium jonesii TaxID=1396493 RepID=UPI0022FE9471|nr:putative methyltransferase-domain-containing protein [Fimicolochytrium jonesii]KAI8816975.1 putative methyltransferase-domain-containing protein [Fimicolochytrium jonesii]
MEPLPTPAEHPDGGHLPQTILTPLTLQYHQRVPIRHFQFPSLPTFTAANQHLLLASTLHSPLSRRYPPAAAYARAFVKMLVRKAEEYAPDGEVNERVLETYVGLLQDGNGAGGGGVAAYAVGDGEVAYTSYAIPIRGEETPAGIDYLTLREETAKISQGTTGLVTWEAALRFGEWLIHTYNSDNTSSSSSIPSIPPNARILELGAGTGFLGLLLARLGTAAAITLSDVDDGVLDRLRENVAINNSPSSLDTPRVIPTVERLDWTNLNKTHLERLDPTHIVCADVVYDPLLVEPLVGVLQAFLALRPSPSLKIRPIPRIAYVALTRRQPATRTLFMDALHAAGICVTTVGLSSGDEKPPEWFWHEPGCGEVDLLVLRRG